MQIKAAISVHPAMTLQEHIAVSLMSTACSMFAQAGTFSARVYSAYKLVNDEVEMEFFSIKYLDEAERIKEVERVRKEIKQGTWTNAGFASEVWVTDLDGEQKEAIMVISEQIGKPPFVLVTQFDKNKKLQTPVMTTNVMGPEILIWSEQEEVTEQ